ncbi:MAG: hypothetical protein P0S94_04655 [Simkaniaceae bacterium]|nr:hypothetical protein [Simkaniaceae bacterium]
MIWYHRNMWILLLLLFTACDKYYVDVKKEQISRATLASSYVGSPDPRQQNPPSGEKLMITWRLPKEALKDPLTLKIQIIYTDFEEETKLLPIDSRRGLHITPLSKKPILSYKAEIVTLSGKEIESWTHQLFFKLIKED